MSFLGIDAGTTGCKVLAFSLEGKILAQSYVEYRIQRPAPGYAQLDAPALWKQIAESIRSTVARIPEKDPPKAVTVTSMGEAVVPVSNDRNILGPSLLNVDVRGREYVEELSHAIPSEELFGINGNVWGDQYGATKLMWLKEHNPSLYEKTDWFLNWAGWISFMLGADPFTDYTLANRSLLFDLQEERWSGRLLDLCGLDESKLPPLTASGTPVGNVSQEAESNVGLKAGTPIIAGAHDQCASAVGCGVIHPGEALYGMGTFPCITPVYRQRAQAEQMIQLGLNVEHHAVSGMFVSFIFHMGGEIVRWYRNLLKETSLSELDSKLSGKPSGLLMLPYLTPMGPPDFISDQTGVLMGLTVETGREQILKGIIEANAMVLQLALEGLPDAGIPIHTIHAAGGGSRSDASMQINSDILGQPLKRTNVVEAGALGAGLLGASAMGLYQSLEEAVETVVRVEQTFEPQKENQSRYQEYIAYLKEAKAALGDINRRFSAFVQSV